MAATNTQIETFLEKRIAANPAVTNLKVSVADKIPVGQLKGWDAFIVSIKADIKQGSKTMPITQRVIYFANDNVITGELSDLKTGKNLRESVAPKFKAEYYKQANLAYGNPNAKHKIAIFSDPLCPFCRGYVPPVLKELKSKPETFAVYYYHFPLERLHPAAPTLARAAIAAEMQGRKDVLLKLYEVPKSISKERNEQKILDAFNKAVNTSLKVSDLHTPAVDAQVKSDAEIVEMLMIGGTPTVYFDGKKDGSKKRYKEVMDK